MGQEILREREDKLKDAENKRGSFIDKLELDNNKIIVNEIDKELANPRVANGLDDISQSKIAMEQKRKAELAEKRRRITDQSADARPVQVAATFFNEDAFLKDEIKSSETSKGKLDSSTKEIVSGTESRMIVNYLSKSDSSPSSQTKSRGEYPPEGSFRANTNDAYSSIVAPDVSRYQKKSQDLTEYDKLVNPMASVDGDYKEYVEAGSLHYALLQTSVDTDEVSPVRATIIQEGPLKGAVLIGSPVRVGEDVHINFHTMSLNKVDYKGINLVSYNPDTGRAGLADSVDRHVFERYFKLFASSAIQGYSMALTGTTTRTYSDGSTEKTTAALPDAKDQAAVALGKVGEKLSPIYEKEFERPPTVYVSQKPIGIMLLSGIELK
jgi:hypothetical protein